jgi:hypothetical protein
LHKIVSDMMRTRFTWARWAHDNGHKHVRIATDGAWHVYCTICADHWNGVEAHTKPACARRSVGEPWTRFQEFARHEEGFEHQASMVCVENLKQFAWAKLVDNGHRITPRPNLTLRRAAYCEPCHQKSRERGLSREDMQGQWCNRGTGVTLTCTTALLQQHDDDEFHQDAVASCGYGCGSVTPCESLSCQ